jgi:hypothetical protein
VRRHGLQQRLLRPPAPLVARAPDDRGVKAGDQGLHRERGREATKAALSAPADKHLLELSQQILALTKEVRGFADTAKDDHEQNEQLLDLTKRTLAEVRRKSNGPQTHDLHRRRSCIGGSRPDDASRLT